MYVIFFFVSTHSAVLSQPMSWKGHSAKNGTGHQPGGVLRRAFRWLLLGCGVTGLATLAPQANLFNLGLGSDRAYSRAYQRLLDSLEGTRVLEARVTGEDAYRPYRPASKALSADRNSRAPSTTRGGASSLRPQVSTEVARVIQTAARRDPSPDNRAALAVLHIVEGHPAAAVPLLREAHAQKPDDPRLLNDLAAALLAMSRETGDPWTALEAIEAAQQSLRLETSLPALFNRALALERCGLHNRAIIAWRHYENEDPRSDWTEEAIQRRARLEQEASKDRSISRAGLDFPALSQNPWSTRQRGERLLLTTWAEQYLAGRKSQAEAALREAELLARTLPAGGGHLLAASIASIRDAEKAEDSARLSRLARGHQQFGQALSLARQDQKGAALSLLEDVIQDFRSARSPFELRARVLRALTVPQPNWAELQELERISEEKEFPSIAAEVKFIAAYRISLEGTLEAAIVVYRDAQARFAQLGEREMSSVMAGMLAELLITLGKEQEAGTELAKALTAGPWVADPWNRYSIYVVAASATKTVDRLSRASVELRLEAGDACRALPEKPMCSLESSLWVAALTQDADIAGDALRRAEELWSAAPELDSKAKARIDLDAAKANWLAKDDRSTDEREEAAELYRDVAAKYQARGRSPSATRARAALAFILYRLGRLEVASAVYRSELAAFRNWDRSDRFRPENAEKRVPRELREVYEGRIEIEVAATRGEPSPEAFMLSEEMRDRLAPRRSAELWLPGRADVDRFVAAVPPNTALVEFAVFGKRAVAWILAGGHLDQVVLATREPLDKRIRALTRESSSKGWKDTSGALYRDLLDPVLDRLPSRTERLVLVPDSELYGLPFRALWDPGSGRYLDESFEIVLAPSVRQFLGFGEGRATAPEPGAMSVLSWGFSSFDPSFGLDPLPWAERETAAVREIYGIAASIGCSGTNWNSFRGCAPQADVIQLATHAAADSAQSTWTWLAFDKETVNLWSCSRPARASRPLVEGKD
jgi:tetratricopeptide (TPR) repeat protein